MDRLRSLHYFIASAEEGSFSAAARRLGVTIPAIAGLVNSLERRLGVSLFERSPQGLALTATGEAYLDACRPSVDALEVLDEQTRSSSTRARGTVVLGVQHVAARELLCPALPRFRARHPEIHLDLRESTQMVDPDAPGIDAYLSFAWPKAPDMVHRALGISRFVVCASPAYWKAHGRPGHPNELAEHDCILVRTQTGTLMDMWRFRRGEETVEVQMKGWLSCSNVHRDVAIQLAMDGLGPVRVLDWANYHPLASGALVPALTDWEALEAPPLYLSYRPSARRLARVRVVLQFIEELVRDWEVRPAGQRIGPQPSWAGSTAARASSIGRKPRKLSA
jgi:DNA-binding transcriptional LysR family regulator